MAVVANRDVMMSALLPGVIMRLHRMAIDTRVRIIAQVARTFSVSKCKRADANKHANDHEQRGQNRS